MKPAPAPQSAVLSALVLALDLYLIMLVTGIFDHWRKGTVPALDDGLFGVGVAFLIGIIVFVLAQRSARRRISRGEFISGFWGTGTDPTPVEKQPRMRKIQVYWIIAVLFLALLGTSYQIGLWNEWSMLLSILASLELAGLIGTALYRQYLRKPHREKPSV